jgi:PAS domain S-box-containing protein
MGDRSGQSGSRGRGPGLTPRELEQHFLELAASVDLVFWFTDLHPETVRYVSPSFEKIWGHPVQALYDNPRLWSDSIHPDDRAVTVTTFEALLTGEQDRYDAEYRIRSSDGDERWIVDHGVAIRNADGVVQTVSGVARDITARKLAEQTAVREKQEWERTFDAADDLIFILDTEYRLVKLNRATTEKLGLAAEDCIGKTCHELIHNTVHHPLLCPFTRMLETGAPQVTEVHEDRLAGDFIVSVSPIHDEAGTLIGAIHMARDVTELKQAERTVRESELRFRQLAETIDQVFWFMGLEPERMLYVSPAWERIWGYTVKELYEDARLWTKAIHPDDIGAVIKAWEPLLRGECRDFEMEYRIRCKNGSERWILDRGMAITNDEGEIYRLSGIAKDITESKRAEAERKELEASRREREKAEGLVRMAGGMAHLFNNHLQVILGNAELASGSNDLTAVRQHLAEISTAAERANRISSRMITFTGSEMANIEPIDLNDLLVGLRPKLVKAVRQRAQFSLELAKSLPPVIGDPDQLQRVVLNLVNNAAEAMGDDPGRISVSSALETGEPDGDDDGHSLVVLTVADDGCGMDPETEKRIFDPFYSTKFVGRGLGLSEVAGIVTTHDGAIRVKSGPGEGTTISILFPVNP